MNDSIKRQDALDALDAEPEVWIDDDEYTKGMNAQWKYDRKAIEALPSAERKGKWIKTSNGDHWKCSRCDCRASFWFNEENSCEWSMDMSEWLSNFCPNCGASMERGMVGGER